MAHRQTALMAVSERTNPGRYRFYLHNSTYGLLEIGAPDGWNSAKYQIKRDTKYWGVTRVISFNDLIFLKAARDYIKDVYESQGINALITFTVTRLDDTTGAYINYFTGKLDLTTYNIEQIGVHCQVLDTSFTEKVRNRENTKVNIRQRISIEGFEVPAFTDEFPQLILPVYEIRKFAIWERNTPYTTTDLSHYVPLLLTTTDLNEAQSQEIAATEVMFLSSESDRPCTLKGNITGEVRVSSPVALIRITIRLYVNGAVENTWMLENDFPSSQLDFTADFDESFTVNTGEDIYITASVLDNGVTNTVEYTDITLQLEENYISLPQRTIFAWPYYEALLRVCQLIGDKNDAIYSDYFGRTDTPIETYAGDGQLGHITRGLFIRGTITINPTVAMSFTDLFQSLNSAFCLGAAIENDRVRIENRRYFFSDTVVLDLSSRIVDEVISKEVVPDLHYSLIKSGYKSFEYNAIGGLAEFNTQLQHTTVISVLDKPLDIVNNSRGDTQGIVKLRQSWGSSEDQEADEHLFLIDSIRDGLNFKARTNEGFDHIEGGVDATQWLNVFLSPARCLRRWGAVIRAGLEKNLGTYLRWQTADKNTTLRSQLTTETAEVIENADILVNDLESPWYCPEYYTVECVMYPDELETIKTNPKGLIKIAADKYGWIWELNMDAEENKVSLKLLRANLDVVTPA